MIIDFITAPFVAAFDKIKNLFGSVASFFGRLFGSKQTMEVATEVSGARASGGSVSAGSSYLVGERGPEIFSPHTNGTIIPNNQISNSRSNITFAPVININGNFENPVSVADAVKRNLEKLLPAVRINLGLS